MDKKRLEVLLLCIVIFCAVFLLVSCKNVSAIQSIEIKDGEEIVVPMGEFSYEGRSLVINYANGTQEEVALTEDMIPEIERLKFFKYGEQEVKVVYDGRYSTTMKINVVRKTFDDIYELKGYTCIYDGQPHKVELNKELPEGASVEYIYGNAFTNVGEYDVVCVLTKEGVESKTLKTKLVIEPASRDISRIEFEDTEVAYTGEPIYIKATNVPEGVDVSYVIYNEASSIKINSAINVGRYKFVARFTDSNDNYRKIEDKEAYLTIEKAKYDMSKVVLSDQEKTYDGQTFTPSFAPGTVLPDGVTATFKCLDKDGHEVESNANAGTYTMVASFKGNTVNYLPIDPIEATLTVNKRVIAIEDKIAFESESIPFDRQVHSIEVQAIEGQGGIPSTINISYENNNQTYAGEYEIIAHFSAKSENETVDVDSMTAYLIINKVKEHVMIEDPDHPGQMIDIDTILNTLFEFDYVDMMVESVQLSNVRKLSIRGLDTEKYEIYYWAFYKPDETILGSQEPFVKNTTYTYEIVFRFVDEDENNSVILSAVSGTYTYTEETPEP